MAGTQGLQNAIGAHISSCEVPFAPASARQSISVGSPPGAHAVAADWQPPADRGGLVCLWQRQAGGAGAADEQRGISWATSAADGSCLTLHEWSLAGSVPAAALRLEFAAPLLPTAAAWSDDGGAVLYLLTADAVLHCLRLRRQDAHTRQPLLHSLSAIGASAINSVALPNAGSLGRPTSLAAVAGAVCIGCSSGLVSCVPLACFASELPVQDAVQLAPSADGFVTRLGRAFWGAASMPGVVDLAPAPVLGPHMLAALYADASLRFWDTKAAAPTATISSLAALSPNGGCFTSLAPLRLRMAATGALRQALLAVQLHGSADSRGSAIEVFTVHFEGRSVGLQHAATLQGPNDEASDLLISSSGSDGGLPHAWVLTPDALHEALLGSCPPCAVLLGGDVRTLSSSGDSTPMQDGIWEVVQAQLQQVSSEEAIAGAAQLARLLTAPGMRCASSLAMALQQIGLQASVDQLEAEGAADAQRRIVHTLQAAASSSESGLAVARSFLAAYAACWRGLHAAAGLGSLPIDSTAAFAVLRGGGRLGLPRPAPPSMAPPQQPHLGHVESAADGVKQLLGALPLELALGAVLSGADVLATLLPALASALASGGLSPATASSCPVSSEHAAAQSAWRLARRQWVAQLRSLLSPLQDPVASLRAYITRIAGADVAAAAAMAADGAAGGAGGGNGAAAVPKMVGDALVAAAGEEAHSAALKLLQVGVLLRFLADTRGAAGWHLTAQQATALQQELLPQALAALLSAAAAFWAASTPIDPATAATTAASAADPAALIGKLQLVAAGGDGRPRLAPAPAQQQGHGGGAAVAGAAGTVTVAHLFLPELARHYGGEVTLEMGLQPWATRFTALLRCPGGGDAAGNGASPRGLQAVRQQLHAYGRALLRARQVALLPGLLRLAGPLATDPALQLLRGMSLVDSLRQPLAQRRDSRAAATEALTPLFAAAAAFRPEADANDAGVTLCRALLAQVQRDTIGAVPQEGPEALELQYYEAMMGQLERAGAPAAAAAFASAAVQHVDAALAGAAAPAGEVARREGRLWANLFEYALQGGAYEEAYAAAISNPEPRRVAEGLSRLLTAMAARREHARLLALPLAGTVTVQRNGREVYTSILAEATAVLQRRAARLEATSPERPYHLLYALHSQRGAHAAAAGAMLAWARRLQAGNPADAASLHDIEVALATAANALACVSPEQAWLVDPAPRTPPSATGPVFGSAASPAPYTTAAIAADWGGAGAEGQDGSSDRQDGSPGDGDEAMLDEADGGADGDGERRLSPAERRQQGATGNGLPHPAAVAAAWDVSGGPQHVLSLADVRREAALAAARAAAAAAAGLPAAAPSSEPADVLQQLLTSGRVDAALALAGAVLQGGQLTAALQTVAAHLATEATRLQLQQPAAGSSATAAWQRLALFLADADGPQHGWRLHTAALRAALAADRCAPPPAWLLRPFTAAAAATTGGGMAAGGPDPAAALRLLLRYDRLPDAARLALSFLDVWDCEVTDVERQRPGAAWFPTATLAELASRVAAERGDAAGLAAVRQRLPAALARHASLVAQQSELLAQSAPVAMA